MYNIQAVRLLEIAEAAEGVSDFGDDGFMAGLRVYLAALRESDLSPDQRHGLEALAVERLRTRLKLVALRNANPAIAAEVIEGPLAVIGLPRTGTSALVDLLAQDPAARAPLQWETGSLFPPADRASWDRDPRIEALQARLEVEAQTSPLAKLGLHTYGARLPDECNSFMSLDFFSPNLFASHHLPRYKDWLRLARPQHPYQTHRWVLQHLQHHSRGGRWTLKSPAHAFDLPGLMDEYPDVMFVHTHRDPRALLPSMCGLIATIRGEAPGDPRRLETGQELVAYWGMALQRATAARQDPVIDARVLDISHSAMVEAPLETVRSVYDRFELAFSSVAQERMRSWIAAPAQHISQKKFTLAEFGLDEDFIDETFADYRRRFSSFF
jgi:hypothetical protein